MKERLHRILRSLIGDELLFVNVLAVEEFGDQTFELKLEHQMSEMFGSHRTFLRWELFGDDDRASFNTEHLWGWLDTDIPDHELIKQLVSALQKNTETWQASDHYLGLREYESSLFLTLNSSGFLLLKWPDEDIKIVLRHYVSNLGAAFLFYDESLTSFRNNWDG